MSNSRVEPMAALAASTKLFEPAGVMAARFVGATGPTGSRNRCNTAKEYLRLRNRSFHALRASAWLGDRPRGLPQRSTSERRGAMPLEGDLVPVAVVLDGEPAILQKTAENGTDPPLDPRVGRTLLLLHEEIDHLADGLELKLGLRRVRGARERREGVEHLVVVVRTPLRGGLLRRRPVLARRVEQHLSREVADARERLEEAKRPVLDLLRRGVSRVVVAGRLVVSRACPGPA